MLKTALFIAIGCCTIFSYAEIIVNSTEDVLHPEAGQITLRSALDQAETGEAITFDPSLNGATLELSIVGEEHSTLVGEIMGMTNAPSGPISYLVGYVERDYGRSALYAQKDVELNASSLSQGITIKWQGGDEDPARVLAVYGDLILKNISITGGRSVAVELPTPDPEDEYGQLSTRARGGGVAVWGVAHLEHCRLYDNHCSRESTVPARSRDAGVFGGGLYADIVELSDSVVCGNKLTASGVSGGGVFSVGGADASETESTLERSAITGNSISGIFTYGGGVYSDGGGIGNAKKLQLTNCTIADNLVGISGPSYLLGMGYWRGGGVYVSNGNLEIRGCTIVENQVHGVSRTNELSKPNLAGGIAATIGNAHAVDSMLIEQSIIAGNTVHESTGTVYQQDIFTGSLFQFISMGHNRFGIIDFSQMLVPVGEATWKSLCRKHYPKQDDRDGIVLADVLSLPYGITKSEDIPSAGVSAPNPAILHYLPTGSAIDQISPQIYSIQKRYAEYTVAEGATNDFLHILLGRLESLYPLPNLRASFTTDFETFLASIDIDDTTDGNQPYTSPEGPPILTLAETQWHGPADTWPSELSNYPYIEFWHRLDLALLSSNREEIGPEGLGDLSWQNLFTSGIIPENTNLTLNTWLEPQYIQLSERDQVGESRPANEFGDIGAIEYVPPSTPAIGMDPETGNETTLHLCWSSAPDQTYTIWGTTDLSSNHWQIIQSGVESTLPVNVHTTQTLLQNQFFKIDVE
jgi:hypothetical protein